MLPLKADGLKWPEHRCLAPLCLPLNKLTCKFWKRSRGTLVPYCKWDGDRRGNHERWMSTSCPRGSGGDHGLSNSHEGVRKMVWHSEVWSPIPLSHLRKYDFFSSGIPGPFQVLGQHRLVYNGRVKSLRKRYSKSQTSCIFLQNPTSLPKPSSPFSFTHHSEIAIKLNSATANTKRRCRIACTWQGLVGLEDGAWTPEQGWPLWEEVGAALTTVPLQAKTKPISKVCGASEKTCLWKGREQWRQREQRREQKKKSEKHQREYQGQGGGDAPWQSR